MVRPDAPGAEPDAGGPRDGRGRLRRLPVLGPVPALRADALRRGHRAGARRASAFARALIGEAALLSGDLALAAAELTEAVALHRDLGSAAGEAHSLQQLAEVRLAQGVEGN